MYCRLAYTLAILSLQLHLRGCFLSPIDTWKLKIEKRVRFSNVRELIEQNLMESHAMNFTNHIVEYEKAFHSVSFGYGKFDYCALFMLLWIMNLHYFDSYFIFCRIITLIGMFDVNMGTEKPSNILFCIFNIQEKKFVYVAKLFTLRESILLNPMGKAKNKSSLLFLQNHSNVMQPSHPPGNWSIFRIHQSMMLKCEKRHFLLLFCSC